MKYRARAPWLLLLTGCAPELDDRASLLSEARLIALIASPAEVRAGESVRLTPIVAGPLRQTPSLSLSFCDRKQPLADPRPLASECLTGTDPQLSAEQNGFQGTIPAGACALFGPDPSNDELRPTDPDATGGYYQPVVVAGLPTPAVASVRIHCPLPDLAPEASRALDEEYELNQNPQLLSLRILGHAESDLTLTAGVPSTLSVTWRSGSLESYPVAPLDGSQLEHRTETLRLSWFSEAGTFASSATGADSENSNASTNSFTAPERGGTVQVWVVAEDSRGGADYVHRRFDIKSR